MKYFVNDKFKVPQKNWLCINCNIGQTLTITGFTSPSGDAVLRLDPDPRNYGDICGASEDDLDKVDQKFWLFKGGWTCGTVQIQAQRQSPPGAYSCSSSELLFGSGHVKTCEYKMSLRK